MAEAVADADFIEECVPEVIAIKHDTLAQISAAARPDAIIGSNTSTISIGELAKAVTNPGRFLGVHFSNPSPFIPGVEIIPHAGTAENTVGPARELVHAPASRPPSSRTSPASCSTGCSTPCSTRPPSWWSRSTATAEDIDTLVRTTFGFRLPFFGPFAIADMAGLDVYNFCYKSLQTEFPERFATPKILTDLVDAGQAGHQDRRGLPERPGRAHPGAHRVPQQGVRGHAEAHRRARPGSAQLVPVTPPRTGRSGTLAPPSTKENEERHASLRTRPDGPASARSTSPSG